MRHARRAGVAGAVAALLTSAGIAACVPPERAPADADTVASAGEVSSTRPAGAVGAESDTLVGAGATDLATLGPADIMAILGAANAGEIATSRVAWKKASSAEVRAFARRMIDAHQAMQTDADRLAERLEVVPGDPTPAVDRMRAAHETRRSLDSAAAGPAFDRRYLDAELQAHQQTLAELQAMERTGHAALRTLVRGAIPRIQAHLRETQRLRTRLGAASDSSGDG